MIKAVVFDCFGVLVTEAWLPFKAKYFGDDPALMDQATEISHRANSGLISQADFINQVAELAGVTPDEVSAFISRNVPDEKLFEYIKELKTDYKIGFLSNIAADYLRRMFSAEQLELFDDISLSFEHGFVKPQPEAYQRAAEGLGVPIEQAIMVDDQERNVTGAREAGMQAILYKDFDQFNAELKELLANPKS